jgi:hypothetical protein
MKNIIKNLNHYADILAIPLFALLTYYFYTLENKNPTEYLLLFFGISGFVLDSLFTYIFFVYSK